MPLHRLTDAEWAALRPHLPAPGPGRPIPEKRARFEALFAAVTSGKPWRLAAPTAREADTLHRHFRRLARAGLWTRLLKALVAPATRKALKPLHDRICAAHRRAVRLLGLPAIALARRLNLLHALPGPPARLPDPDLSETVHLKIIKFLKTHRTPDAAFLIPHFRRLLRLAGGSGRIPHGR